MEAPILSCIYMAGGFIFFLSRFSVPLLLAPRYDLCKYGFDAKVVYIPGHSKGSIGILTEATGDLFCGDLMENIEKPVFSSIIDDLEAANTSIEKLESLKINTVYPGHGKPFAMKLFANDNKQIKKRGKSI